MIASFASYADAFAMAGCSNSSNTGQPAQKIARASLGFVSPAVDPSGESTEGLASDADSVDLSAPQNVFAAVDNFFNLGKSDRFNDFNRLSPQDKKQFAAVVAELAKSGYVGYEELVVNNKLERHDVETKVGDARLYHAEVYDSSCEEA